MACDAPRKSEDIKKKGDSKDRVLVYTAPVGGGEKRGRYTKGKEKDKKDKYVSKPLDLTKTAPKRHGKYKDKNDVVQDDTIEMEALPEGLSLIHI